MTSAFSKSFAAEGQPAGALPFDPRSICNLMLDEADDVPITNLALQKLLYFIHGLHLIETKTPLVMGYFEAWQHGPVHPAAYGAFKAAGKMPIAFRATRQNPLESVPDQTVL